jgi:putative lipoprotein
MDLNNLGVGSTGDSKATLRLENGQAAGTDGCNQFSGTYETDGDDLTFGPLATTGMMCITALDAAGRKVQEGLAATKKYSIDGATLTLEDADGKALLTWDEGTAEGVVGDWEITGYLDAAKQAFTSPNVDTPATLTLSDDGAASGNAGCNDFTGTYSADATSITFSPLAMTRKACTPDEVMTQEGLIAQNLDDATTWQTTSYGIDFFNAEGTRVISLAPKT